MILSGSPLDFFEAFVGGVLVSFTPCVYPLIPITASYIGVNAGMSRARGFVLSLIYVTGIAVTYAILGLVASFTGMLFGRISSYPLTYFIVGGIIIIFGLSTMDFFVLKLPQLVKLPNAREQSYISTFFLGLSSGLIASPCLTPVLGSILFYLTTKKNVFYGTLLLFSFAYGMGLLLIIVGTFSATLLRLPRIGKWMTFAKWIAAVVLIAVGAYFIYNGIRRM